ncbi:MAG: hypothetical protein ACYCS1_05070 [Gammaproteobacteria bacterium]
MPYAQETLEGGQIRNRVLVSGRGYKKQYAYVCMICNEQGLSRKIKKVRLMENIYQEEANESVVHRKPSDCWKKFEEQYEYMNWIEGAKHGLIKNRLIDSWVRKPIG